MEGSNSSYIQDKCGIFAIADDKDVYYKTINGLKFLQHRGQESAGISYTKGNIMHTYKSLGLVETVFNDFSDEFNIGIGHVRYSTRKKTTNSIKHMETQPISGNSRFGKFSVAHNGNIPLINKIKEKYDINYDTESDTIILVKIIEKLSHKYVTWLDVLIDLIHGIEGVYCLVILLGSEIYAIRDAHGVRPLCLGQRENGGYCIASESRALQEYHLIRDVKPGEILCIREDLTMESLYQRKLIKNSFCSFEYIYFMKPDSITHGNTKGGIFKNKLVENIRYQLGYELGKQEAHVDRTAIVLSVPNTPIPAAKGFARAVDLEYYDYIEKRKDAGRTFILPTDKERIDAVEKKYIFHPELKDHNVYIIDDSIVRGITFKSIIKKLKNIGVRKIHIRITSPPVISECYYGIDIPTKRELIAYEKSVLDIRKELSVTTLKYMDIKSMKKVFNENICTSCFDGKYNQDLLSW